MSDYALEGAKWDSSNVTWSFADITYSQDSSAPFSSAITGGYQVAVQDAIQRWASVSGLAFTEVPDSADPAAAADIRIGFGDFDTPATGIAGQTDIRYTAGGSLLPDAVVRLEDPSEVPLIGNADSGYTYQGFTATLYQDALHEIGHALGLAHSTDPGAIMSPSIGTADPDLDGSDIAGIQSLYGGPAPAPATQASASDPSAQPAVPVVSAPAPVPEPAPAAGGPVLDIPADQSDAFVAVSGTTVNADAGSHSLFLTGSGDTVLAGGGADTIFDVGGNNTILLPAPGQGSDALLGGVLSNGDTLDLSRALAGTGWDRDLADLGNYLTVQPTGNGAVTLDVDPAGSGAGSAVVTLYGAGTVGLADLLPHLRLT